MNFPLYKLFVIDYLTKFFNIIQIYYNKDIKFFGKDFTNIALKTRQCFRKIKKPDLVLNIVVSDMENKLLLIIFLNSHLIIGISKIQLKKSLNLA